MSVDEEEVVLIPGRDAFEGQRDSWFLLRTLVFKTMAQVCDKDVEGNGLRGGASQSFLSTSASASLTLHSQGEKGSAENGK